MDSLQSSLYTVAVALCLFSTGILQNAKRGTERSFACFTGFLVIETMGFVLELLMVHPATPLKSLWLGLRLATSLLVAPSLWLAVKESVEGVRPRIIDLGRRPLVAIVAGALLTLPLIANAHLGTEYVNPERVTAAWHSRVIHTTMLLCIGIFSVQVPIYLWRCRQLLLTRLGREDNSPGKENTRALRWLHLPLVVAFTTWALGLIRTLQCATHAPAGLSVVFALVDVSVTVGAIYVLVRRASAVPAFEAAPLPDAKIQPVAAVPAPVETKYARSPLDASVRARIRRKLETALATEEICADSLLNLRSLSRHVNEKAHYVSQVINQDLNASFYELLNGCRIERAKKLLTEAPGQTVLEVALSVGFNSKSTFNTAFRQNTGMTPSEFRAAQRGKA